MMWLLIIALLIAAAAVWWFSPTNERLYPAPGHAKASEGTHDPYLRSPNHPVFRPMGSLHQFDGVPGDYDNGIEAALAELGEPDPPVLINDHAFDAGWHIRAYCQHIYEGASDFTEDTVCGETRTAHVADDAVVRDEDDKCPGHPTVLGGLVSCDLPFGHRGVDTEPYDWAKDQAEDET